MILRRYLEMKSDGSKSWILNEYTSLIVFNMRGSMLPLHYSCSWNKYFVASTMECMYEFFPCIFSTYNAKFNYNYTNTYR